MSSTTRRPAPIALKPPTSLSSTCVVSDTASLSGTHLITILGNAIIHPRAKIVAIYGPVTIGEGCVVCERGSVGLLTEEDEDKVIATKGVSLEKNVTVEAAAIVEARRVGEGTTIELAAKLGKGAVIGKHCKITPLTQIAPCEVLSDFSVAYGSDRRRKGRSGQEELKEKLHEKQIEVLKRMIPSNTAKWRS